MTNYGYPTQKQLDGSPRAAVLPMPTQGARIEPRVLFMDIDGVVITPRSHLAMGRAPGGVWLDPDPVALGVIRRACDAGVRIVVSSTWRLREQRCRDWLALHELTSSLHRDWRTPDSSRDAGGVFVGGRRGGEIGEWLKLHPEVRSYRILDDDTDMLPEQVPYFIRCNSNDGLSYEGIRNLLAWAGVIQPREAA